MTSPGSRCGSSCSIRSSTAGPALTSVITKRGRFSDLTKSAIVWQPTNSCQLRDLGSVDLPCRWCGCKLPRDNHGSRRLTPSSHPDRQTDQTEITQLCHCCTIPLLDGCLSYCCVCVLLFGCRTFNKLRPCQAFAWQAADALLNHFKRRLFRQVLIELLEEHFLVSPSEGPVKELFHAFVVETFPARFFVTWIDRVERLDWLWQRSNHQEHRRSSSSCWTYFLALTKISFLVPASCPQISTTYFSMSCSCHSALRAGVGVAEQTITSALAAKPASSLGLLEMEEHREPSQQQIIHCNGPFRASVKAGSPASLTISPRLGCRVSFRSSPSVAAVWHSDLDATSCRLQVDEQAIESFNQRGKAIDATALGIQVNELCSFASIFADRLQVVVVDMLGMKHSLCFNSIESNAQPSESMPTKKSCLV